MKRFVFGVAFVFGFGFVAAACSDDDSGSGIDYAKECSEVCQKEHQCDAQQDEASCESDCMNSAPHMLDGFVTATIDCIMSHTCDELDNGACDQAGLSACTTDIRPMLEVFCAKQVGCEGGLQSDIDTCVEQGLADDDNEMFKCFKASALDDLAQCIDGLACDEIDDRADDCLESALGIRFETVEEGQ